MSKPGYDTCECGKPKTVRAKMCKVCDAEVRHRRSRDQEVVAARFWKNVDTSAGPDACWPWLRFRDWDGYGRFSHMLNGKYLNEAASRVAYRLTYGEFDPTLEVCHRCDNPPCCNPSHLFLGTSADNSADAVAKGRMAHVGKHGHNKRGSEVNTSRLTAEQVIEIRQKRAQGVYLKDLAKEYGVAYNAIWCIVQRKHWKHLP